MRTVYLDYAATTPVDLSVAECMSRYLTLEGTFGNPASPHRYGRLALQAVEAAQLQVAELIGAAGEEIVWTSGATEANNLALIGVARANQQRGKHIVTSQSEHKSVLDSCRYLEGEGWQVTYLKPQPNGLLDIEKFVAALRRDTVLASIMHVNNETGVIQDIKTLAQATRSRGIPLHVDAVQSAGKIPIDVAQWPVDLMSLSAHKVYGPKGIGALYLRNASGVRIEAQSYGGGQQRGLRSGTLPTHQIVGMGEAFSLAKANMADEGKRLEALRDRLWQALRDIEGLYQNGEPTQRAANYLNITLEGVDNESLMASLPDIAFSPGSACSAERIEPSHVLRSMGIDDARAQCSIRLTLGRFSNVDDIDYAINRLRAAISALR